MFDSILVPLDGSQLAECVIPHVFAVAQSNNSEITLLRIMEKGNTDTSAQLFDLLNWQINKKKAILYLEKMKARFQGSGLKTHSVVQEGLAAEGIIEYAQRNSIKIIILSSHGKSGLTQWGLSNVSQKIILSAMTSLLIIRAHQFLDYAGKFSEQPVYQRILVPLDGSQRAENVLPAIVPLALFHKSQIHLVQVVQTPEMARQMPTQRSDIDLSKRIITSNQEEAVHYLEQVKSRSSLDGIDVQTHLITSDNAAVSLHELVEQQDIDLLLLGAHGYSGNLQWPYGSLVNNFIMYGKIPLMIVQDLPARQEPMTVEMSSREKIEH
jgi:nucleotide-binding universal stress UspA family protein